MDVVFRGDLTWPDPLIAPERFWRLERRQEAGKRD